MTKPSLVREQMKEPGANDSLYLSTLSKVAKKDATARKELTDYALISLNNKRGDARQQLNYAYILINNGRKAKCSLMQKPTLPSMVADGRKCTRN